MKLYVIHKGKKIYLRNTSAPSRNELAHKLGRTFYLNFGDGRAEFNVSDVKAELEDNYAVGLIVGALIGILAGPIGLVVGGLLGMLIAQSKDQSRNEDAVYFNNSQVYES